MGFVKFTNNSGKGRKSVFYRIEVEEIRPASIPFYQLKRSAMAYMKKNHVELAFEEQLDGSYLVKRIS